MMDFREFVSKEIFELGLSPLDVVNMDEVPMSFDIPPTRTVNASGAKTVAISTTGHERSCFTVVLACTASGAKLKPMVVFKRITMPRENLPPNVVVVCNKKGWMNSNLMKLWVDKCFKTRPGGFLSAVSLLIADAMAAHREKSVQNHLNEAGAHVAIIPGGLTCKLQPLDIAVNRSFKTFVRNEWNNWMQSDSHDFTASGRLKRATYSEVCKWIASAWEKVTSESICNGFRKAGIALHDDGVPSDIDEPEERSIGYDPMPSKLKKKQLQTVQNYFDDSDKDSDFDGFEISYKRQPEASPPNFHENVSKNNWTMVTLSAMNKIE